MQLFGLFHARKLRVHELALRAGWDTRAPAAAVSPGRFYDRFTPAIAASDFALRPAGAADLDRALDFVAVCRRVSCPPPGTAAGDRAGRRAASGGALAIVLHTHMPYVEGFGTWPFGEEWLWEAIVGCYLPLLDLLDARRAADAVADAGARATSSRRPGVPERFDAFVEDVRRDTHASDAAGLRAGGDEALARELERAWRDYERALERLAARGGDLLGALARHAQWTSSATHAILPLLATDAGVRLQVQQRHRRAPRAASAALARRLLAAGVRVRAVAGARPSPTPACAHVCVELTGRFGARRARAPAAARAPTPAWCSCRSIVPRSRWCGATTAIPPSGAYRDYHRHTIHHHNPWSNDGDAYDHEPALALAREHAADFVTRTLARLRGREGGAGCRAAGWSCARSTPSCSGHWWYEGVAWLRGGRRGVRAPGPRARAPRRCLRPVRAGTAGCDLALGAGAEWPASSWGENGDLSTWSGPAVAELAFATRAAELEVARRRGRAGRARRRCASCSRCRRATGRS